MSDGVTSARVDGARHCRGCGAALWHRNKTGLCRRCAALDPELQARRAGGDEVKMKRAAATRLALAAKPEIREKQRRRSAEFNRLPEIRESARRRGSSRDGLERMARARAAKTEATHQRQGRSLSERHLSKVPRDQRDLYLHLTRVKRLPADEALAVVTDHEAAEMERFRREIEAGAR